MIELLKLCGFEADEAELELPRIKKAFDRLGITAEDIERGKQRLTKYYDVELKGVRKILRLFVKQLVDTMLAREEGKTKIIYGFMSPGVSPLGCALVSNSEEVHADYLCPQFQVVVGCIFDKMEPILEVAEKQWLKTGRVSHCGNIKELVGLLALDLIPKPDLLFTSGLLCDAAPKTIDLLQELYDIPTCSYDACQDREWDEFSAATNRMADLAAKSIRRLTKRFQQVVGFEVTDDMLQQALDAKVGLSHAVGKLVDLIASSDPLPLSANHQLLFQYLGMFPFSIDSLPDVIDATNTLYKELLERVDKGVGVVEKGAPRIIALLPSHHTDPIPDCLTGELGMAIASTEMEFAMSDVEKWEDPYEELVALEILQSSLFASLSKRIEVFLEGCKRLNAEGVLDRFHVGCRTTVGDALVIKHAITKEMGIPVIVQERDDFDTRLHKPQQYTKEFKLLKTMLDSRERRRS